MKAFDAECSGCNTIRVIWVGWEQEPGDVVKYAHPQHNYYGNHLLVAELNGLSGRGKWGPPGEVDGRGRTDEPPSDGED